MQHVLNNFPHYLLQFILWFILLIGLVQNLVYLFQLPAACNELREKSQLDNSESAWHLFTSDLTIPISIIVPALNEATSIVENVRAMLALRYPDIEVIIVSDGSQDGTVQALIEAFDLRETHRAFDPALEHQLIQHVYACPTQRQLIVVDKLHGGKSDSINAGLNLARNPLFCVIDADSILEAEALLSAVRPFMEEPHRMIAVGGTIRILNDCKVVDGRVESNQLPKRFLPRVQYMEYLRAFLMARLAWSRWGMLLIISGAFGIFRRDIALEVGGYCADTVGEDYELVVKMHRHMCDQKRDYAMRYVPEPVCWTEAPESLKVLSAQRKRWQRGALEVFFKYRAMFMNKKYKKIGLLGFMNSLILDIIGPLVEVSGYILVPIFWVLGYISKEFALAYIALVFVFGIFISVGTLILEEMELHRVPCATDLAVLGGIAILENFGYRQISSIWKMLGWIEFLRKKKTWGMMTRKGFGQKAGRESGAPS